MKVSIGTLSGAALDWAVAQCEGYEIDWLRRQLTNPNPATRAIPAFSSNWADGGPIIARERICIEPFDPVWRAARADESNFTQRHHAYRGRTPLIAAMRCYAASQRGDVVDIPVELLPHNSDV
jgi:hypothetical protein